MSLKSHSPDSKAEFSKKSNLGVWRLILSMYRIILHVQHLVLNKVYEKHNVITQEGGAPAGGHRRRRRRGARGKGGAPKDYTKPPKDYTNSQK